MNSSKLDNSCYERAMSKVAVIGAGAAGLVACKELMACGHQVTVFEKGDKIGGVWVYDAEIENDLLGIYENRRKVHSSMYASLRTNLPRECMSFLDFPFLKHLGSTDENRYCGHEAVLKYLEHFSIAFNVEQRIEFETEVIKVELVAESELSSNKSSWLVHTVPANAPISGERTVKSTKFDSVIICNGHYSQPKLATIPGIQNWPGIQWHSHNYRSAESFKDKVVVLIGASASGVDIARELSFYSTEVHLCSRSWSSDEIREEEKLGPNLFRHTMVRSLAHQRVTGAYSDGRVTFEEGSEIRADIIMHCTGYTYHFPFLHEISPPPVTVSEGRVDPLYEHIFPIDYGPNLSFVGIPWQVAPFPLMQIQSKWIAKILAGDLSLPPKGEMKQAVQRLYQDMEEACVPIRYTHSLGSQGLGGQFEYLNRMLKEIGEPPLEKWREEMYLAAGKLRRIRPDDYRNSWEDAELVLEAALQQKKFLEQNPQWFKDGTESPWPHYVQEILSLKNSQ